MAREIGKAGIVFGTVVIVFGVMGNEARAFNTGGHFEATKRALEAKGFNHDAIRLTRAANFYADFTSELPEEVMDYVLPILVELPIAVFGLFALVPAMGALIAIEDFRQYLNDMKDRGLYFHFLGLRDARRIAHDHDWLEAAGKKFARDARDANDPERLLITMGIVLHAIQDSQTHTNMADIDWNAWVGQPFPAFDELPEDIWGNPRFALPSGNEPRRRLVGAYSPPDRHGPHTNKTDWPRHGDGFEACDTYPDGFNCGLNHDSSKRNHHLNAIMGAWRASEIWVDKFKAWVADSRFWGSAQTYSNSDAAAECEGWARALSIGGHGFGWSEEPNGAKTAWAFSGVAFACGDQRTKMSEVLVGLYEHNGRAPRKCGKDANAAAGRNCWVDKFGAASNTNRSHFVGTFNATWGRERATMTVSESRRAGVLSARYEIGRETWKMRGDVHGDRWDFEMCRTNHCTSGTPANDKRTGVVYYTGHGSRRKSMAGFLRDSDGVPNGFMAVVR